MNRFLSLFCKIFLKPFVDRFLIEEVKGLENVPKPRSRFFTRFAKISFPSENFVENSLRGKGNFILAANHQSHLDQIAIGYLCVPRRFHMIGQTDRYSGLTKILLYLIYFLAGVIPINRESEESRKRALEESVKVLKMGDILIIYPEGTRSRTGQIQPARPGVAKLHLKTGVPILPVGIKGTFELMPTGRGFPKIKRAIKINIGKPLHFKEGLEKAKNLDCNSEEYKNICQKIIDKVMEEISKLIRES